jgi:hypothetical protein
MTSKGKPRMRALIGVICLCSGVPAYCQDRLAADLAIQRLDHLLAHRQDNTFRARHEQTAHSQPDTIARWLDGEFLSVLHPTCPDGPCPDAELDPARKIQAFRVSAEAGNSHNQFVLGVYYLNGVGVDKDIAQGVMWIEKAAANKDSQAAYVLAEMYEVGELVPNDPAKAINLYKTASQGTFSGPALIRLGEIYEFGTGVTPDYSLALRWYERASAEHHRVFAAFPCPPCAADRAGESLGSLYAQGEGVPRDYTSAARWFLEATNDGAGYGGENWVAQCALAIMYAGGLGVKEDERRSVFWLNRPNTRGAAECRDWPASPH